MIAFRRAGKDCLEGTVHSDANDACWLYSHVHLPNAQLWEGIDKVQEIKMFAIAWKILERAWVEVNRQILRSSVQGMKFTSGVIRYSVNYKD